MDNAVAPRKRPAPYGQSCVNCVKAKCRCMFGSEDICERCSRLNKTCTPFSSVRKRAGKPTQASRTTQLEHKLDEVASLLRMQQAISANETVDRTSMLTPASLADSESEELTDWDLVQFRDLHLKHFPFVELPSTLTAEQLKVDRPFFSSAIHVICTKAISRQSKLAKQLREELALRILAEGERSLDLLLGVLVSIAWSTYVTHGKQYLGMLCNCARSLVSDLKLDKPTNPAGCPSIGPQVENKQSRSREDCRVLLATFSVSTIVSTTFKYDFMLWSPQIEEACQILSKEEKVESDEILVSMARLSKVSVSAADVARRVGDDPANYKQAVLSIEPLRMTLQTTKATMKAKVFQCSAVMAHSFAAEIAINELALLSDPADHHASFSPIRLENLIKCLQACKTCCDFLLEGDTEMITAPAMLMFPYAIKVVHKLSSFKDVDWDPVLAHDTMDIAQCFERTVHLALCANSKYKAESGEDSVLAAAAEVLRSTAPNWRIPLKEKEVRVESSTSSLDGEIIDLSMVDFSDDFWQTSIFNF